MNQINKDEYIEVGYIQKPHALKGDVILIFGKEFEEIIEEAEFVFVEVGGGIVPFFVEEDGLLFRTDEIAICSLRFVDSVAKAKELSGCKVFVHDNLITSSADHEVTSSLIGMRAYDAKFGEIGLISRVDDFSGNFVITVDHTGAEIMIPLSDEVIELVDEEKRELYLKCPAGLIEMYLE